MNKNLIPKIIVLAVFASFFGIIHLVKAVETTPQPSATVGNVSPVFNQTPADDSDTSSPTNDAADVTFSAKGIDVNGDQYYLAICSSDAVTHGGASAPSCAANDEWAISSATDSNTAISDLTYTTGTNSDAESNDCTGGGETCPWYAFVCDSVSGGACFPANGSGDQGLALGTVTFSDVPADEDDITIDSVQYRFDLGGNGCVGANDVCIDTSSHEDGQDTAAALAAAETGASSHMTARGAVTYVYADSEGTGGNSIGMTIGTCANCSLSGATLSGGDATGQSPFYINHAPAIGAVTIGDTSGGGGLNPATGTDDIYPGETIYINAVITDTDSDGGQDTIDMYVCDSAGFTYGGSPACDGSLICSDLNVDPTTDYAECNDSGSEVPIPTAHGTYTVYIYTQDNHDMQGTGTNNHNYDVQDAVPTYVSYTYGTPASPFTVTAGSTQAVTFTVRANDDNGWDDITAISGTFFDATAEVRTCYADNGSAEDHNDCYYDTTCTLSQADATDANGACSVTAYYNANASSNWEMNGIATDGNGAEQFSTDSNDDITINANGAIDVVDVGGSALTTMSYGTLAIGETSSSVASYVGNAGNQTADFTVQGVDMCSDWPTCSGSLTKIGQEQQKWHHNSSTFDWDTAESADAGPWILDESSGAGGGGDGCANRNIAIRNDGTSTTEGNEQIYWKIRIPTVPSGTYTGENTFAYIASDQCTGTEY